MTAHAKSEGTVPEFMSIAEAAALYHVSRDFLRDRIIDGSLPAVRSGRRIIRIGRGNLERLFRPVQSMRSLK